MRFIDWRIATIATIFLATLAGCGAEEDGFTAGAGNQDPPGSTPTNSAPTISGTPALNVTAGIAYAFQPVAADADGDSLTFGATGLPSWASIDSTTGMVTGTPTEADVGQTANIVIGVTDGEAGASLPTFRITIATAIPPPPPPPTNVAPSISGSPATTVQAGSAYAFIPSAADADSGSLTFLISNKPGWASFNGTTGRLAGTPTSAQVGTYGNIVISVSDGSLSTSLPVFSIQVTAVPNRAPVIGGTPGATATVGVAYSFTPSASDADGQTLTFSITNRPSWASLNTSTGRLSGTPSVEGTHSNIIITASDGTASTSLAAFSIVVGPAPNHAPTISGTPATSATAGTAYTFTPVANDTDNDSLSYSIQGKPSWATFSVASGTLSGTPTSAQVGSYSGIVITVTDAKQASVSLPSFSIAVQAAANHAPTISGTPSVSVTVGSSYSFVPTASDADADTLSFSISGNKPAWLSINSATGAVSGQPLLANVGTTSNIVISVSDGHGGSASLSAFSLTVNDVPVVVVDGAPRVLYTDMVAGPVSGGENNLGTYLSIFGKNFGADPSKVHVYLGNTEVAAYKYLGSAKGRSDLQQITVQPGAVGTGSLAIKVVVDGVSSNTDQSFRVNPGDILFVDSVSGNDSTGIPGDIAHPYRHVQTSSHGGAMGAAGPGDVIVLRGGTWTDSAVDSCFVRFTQSHESGKAPTGSTGTGYLAITAYPGEAVTINAPNGGGIMGSGETQKIEYVVLANLKIVSPAGADTDGAPINLQVSGDYWRVVNNDVSWPSASAGRKAGGVVGNGANIAILGNEIHDIAGGTENHGIYLDTATTNTEVAYNNIHHVTSGNLIQTFDNLGSGVLTNLQIHHNLIHDGGRYGLNMSDGTRSVHAWDNLIYNTVYSGIRLSINEGASASHLYEHNTLYNVCTNHPQEPAAIFNGWNIGGGSVRFQYNVLVKGSGGCGAGYDSDGTDSGLSMSRNLFYGYSAPGKDLLAVTGNPLLTSPATGDFHLGNNSPALDAALTSTVTDDFDAKPRTLPDLGAYER